MVEEKEEEEFQYIEMKPVVTSSRIKQGEDMNQEVEDPTREVEVDVEVEVES